MTRVLTPIRGSTNDTLLGGLVWGTWLSTSRRCEPSYIEKKKKRGVVDEEERARRDGLPCGRKGVDETRTSHRDAELRLTIMATTAA
eukprot:7771696-Heterocapsa_arctica.AAC.1